MKNSLLTLMVASGVLFLPYSAMAIGRRTVSCEAAQQGMTLAVTNGIGVDIRLACAGNIADAQVSDPSRIVVRKRGPQQLYIKPIGTINFPGNLHSADGMTMLSVVTTTGDVYQFAIRTTSSSSYSFLDVGGQSRSPLPFTTAYRPRVLPPRLARTPQTERPLPRVMAERPFRLVKPLPVVQQSPQLFKATTVRTEQQFAPAPSPVQQNQPPALPVRKPDFISLGASPVPQNSPSVSTAKEPDFTASQSSSDVPTQATVTSAHKPVLSVSKTHSTSRKSTSKVPTKLASKLPTQKTVIITKSHSTPVSQANAIVRGLAQLRREKKIAYRDSFWLKVQDVVYLLRTGKTVEHASKQAGVSLSKIQYLLTLGGDKSISTGES